MRASVMLHLPGLGKSGQITKIAATVSKLGLIIRGAYGEGTSPSGDMYQLSNQVTLGIGEETALNNLKSIAQQLVAQELAIRAQMLQNPVWEDKIFRLKYTIFWLIVLVVLLAAGLALCICMLLQVTPEWINELFFDNPVVQSVVSNAGP